MNCPPCTDSLFSVPEIFFPIITRIPGLILPSILPPNINLPDLTLPDLSLPDLNLPDLQLPNLIPQLSIPALPDISNLLNMVELIKLSILPIIPLNLTMINNIIAMVLGYIASQLYNLAAMYIEPLLKMLQGLTDLLNILQNLNINIDLSILNQIQNIAISISQLIASIPIPAIPLPSLSLSIQLPDFSILIKLALGIQLPGINLPSITLYSIRKKEYISTMAAIEYYRYTNNKVKMPYPTSDINNLPIKDDNKRTAITMFDDLYNKKEELKNKGVINEENMYLYAGIFNIGEGCLCRKYKRMFIDNNPPEYDTDIVVYAFEKSYNTIKEMFVENNGVNWLDTKVQNLSSINASSGNVLFYIDFSNNTGKWYVSNWDWADEEWFEDYNINGKKAPVILVNNDKLEYYCLYNLYSVLAVQ